jgi:hypothetical protein
LAFDRHDPQEIETRFADPPLRPLVLLFDHRSIRFGRKYGVDLLNASATPNASFPPPAINTRPSSKRTDAFLNVRPGPLRAVQLPGTGLKRSGPLTPAKSTVPSRRRVALSAVRLFGIACVGVHAPIDGSYRAAMFSLPLPPAARTRPSFSSVSVYQRSSGYGNEPVKVHRGQRDRKFLQTVHRR